MQEPLVLMFLPVLGEHISETEFQYPDNNWKVPTGIMANLVAKNGDNKGQLCGPYWTIPLRYRAIKLGYQISL